MGKLKLMPKFAAGLWNNGSAPLMLVTGITNIISKDTEYFNFQSGHLFYQPIKNEDNLKMVNGVLMEPCNLYEVIDKRYNIKNIMSLPENYDLVIL